MLHRYQGQMGCALILGCYDINGPQLVQIAPHGSYGYNEFAAMGSGSLAAMTILESKYREDMTVQQGIDICVEAIEAGIKDDLASGSNVDVAIMRQEGETHTRSYKKYVVFLFIL
jgi:20S proteasome subunit beta 2